MAHPRSNGLTTLLEEQQQRRGPTRDSRSLGRDPTRSSSSSNSRATIRPSQGDRLEGDGSTRDAVRRQPTRRASGEHVKVLAQRSSRSTIVEVRRMVSENPRLHEAHGRATSRDKRPVRRIPWTMVDSVADMASWFCDRVCELAGRTESLASGCTGESDASRGAQLESDTVTPTTMTASFGIAVSTRRAKRIPTLLVPTMAVGPASEESISMGEHQTGTHCPGSRIPRTISGATTAQLPQALRQARTQLLPIALTMQCSRPPSQRLLRRSRPGYRHLRHARRHCQRSRSNPTQGPSRLVKRSSTSMMWHEPNIVSKGRIDFQLHQRKPSSQADDAPPRPRPMAAKSSRRGSTSSGGMWQAVE